MCYLKPDSNSRWVTALIVDFGIVIIAIVKVFVFPGNAFTAPINYYRSAFFLNNMSKMGTASRSKRGAVSMPTLIIWGEPDAYLEKELAKLSSECCSGQVIIKYVENGGHFVHMVEPAIVNTHIRNFLKAC